ncbi:unnamed protein product, partial [Mesorhabditis belari]
MNDREVVQRHRCRTTSPPSGNSHRRSLTEAPPVETQRLPMAEQPGKGLESHPLKPQFDLKSYEGTDAKPETKDRVLHMIALNVPLSGRMSGLRGADLQCYKESRQAGFVTTFRAMLSSKVQDMSRIVHAIDRGTRVVNLKGEELFPSWDELLLGRPPNEQVPLYTFHREDVFTSPNWNDRRIWHGSIEGGMRADDSICDGWRTGSAWETALASQLVPGRPLVGDAEKVGCDARLVVLCVENMSKYNVDRILAKKNVHELN